MKKFLTDAVTVLSLCSTIFLSAQEPNWNVPQFSEVKIKLDGIPDEKFWTRAAKFSHFKVFHKQEPAPGKTEFKICADKRNLYIALQCNEPKGVFVSPLKNGYPWSGDCVEIFFAGVSDDKDWYRQIVLGTNGDTYSEFIRKNEFSFSVKNKKKMWTAEVVVPLEHLGTLVDNSFRFNVLRKHLNAHQYSVWQDIFFGHDVWKFAKLTLFTPPEQCIHGPWTFGITSKSVGINWETSGFCNGIVFYRKKGEEKFQSIKSNIVAGVQQYNCKLHPVYLHNLETDTEYEYHLGDDDTLYSFRTLAVEPADFSFAVTSDIHTRSYDLDAILTAPAVKKTDLMFLAGDMVSAMIGRNICYDAFLDSLVKNCHQAYYCIRGNHEYRGGASGAFFDLFADPEQRSYFAFQHKGIFFILLDSDGDQRDDSVYIEKQIDWLKITVGSKEFQQAEYRVVIAHKPLFLGNQIKKIFNQLSVQERNSIDLMITGHVHAYAKVLPGNPLVYAPGNKLDQTEHKQNESFPQLINDASGYILVNKDSEKLSVKVFDRHLKCVDKLLIKRKKSLPNPLKF